MYTMHTMNWTMTQCTVHNELDIAHHVLKESDNVHYVHNEPDNVNYVNNGLTMHIVHYAHNELDNIH